MFYRKTVLELVDAFKFQTNDEVDRFALEFCLEDIISGKYLKEKVTSIAGYFIANPDEIGPNGASLLFEVLEHLIKKYPDFETFAESNFGLINSLDRDGYEITESGNVRKKLPNELPVVEQENQLIFLLDKYDFDTAIGHYENAVSSHARGEWAAANAQLRTFVEEFFNKTQQLICPGDHLSSNEQRIALAKSGFFISEYNEFLYNGKGFIEGFWKRLHPQGSHPGLSDQSDSTFRLHLVILVIHNLITRLDEKYSRA